MFLKKLLIIAFIIVGMITFAEADANITIDPVGTLQAGEKFSINGTTTIEKVKKIGIEIFPKEFWDETKEYAMVNNTGKVRYKELSTAGDIANTTGINLVRYNMDGTQSYLTVDVPEDYAHTIVPVKKDGNGKMTFSAEINEKVKKVPFQPGKYHLNVYDASMEIERPGTILTNGWDFITKTIYPSTSFSNLWDERNMKEMASTEFTIQ